MRKINEMIQLSLNEHIERFDPNSSYNEIFYLRFVDNVKYLSEISNTFKKIEKESTLIEVNHILESLFINDELKLINYLYHPETIFKSELEKMIKTIYDSSTYQKDDKKIIFLVDLKKKVKKTSLEKLPIRSHIKPYIWKDNNWEPLLKREEKEIGYDNMLSFLSSLHDKYDNKKNIY